MKIYYHVTARSLLMQLRKGRKITKVGGDYAIQVRKRKYLIKPSVIEIFTGSGLLIL
jgi:hypothetical protein